MEDTTQTRIDSRERLLAAAQELFAEQGVAATTPRQVLQRSAVGQGSLYHHFPTKRDLAQAAVARTARQQLEAAQQVLTGDGTATERISAYLLRERDAVSGCRVGRLTADPLVMSEQELQRPVAEYFTSLTALVGEVLQEAGLPPDRAQDLGAAVVAVVQGGYVLARSTGSPELMQHAVRGLFALIAEHTP